MKHIEEIILNKLSYNKSMEFCGSYKMFKEKVILISSQVINFICKHNNYGNII